MLAAAADDEALFGEGMIISDISKRQETGGGNDDLFFCRGLMKVILPLQNK